MDNNEQITTPLAVIILSFALKMKVFQNSINTIQKILLCHVFDGKAERLIYSLAGELHGSLQFADDSNFPCRSPLLSKQYGCKILFDAIDATKQTIFIQFLYSS